MVQYRYNFLTPKVHDGSKAASGGVKVGQRLLKINGKSTSKMTQDGAKNAIKSSGKKLKLYLQGER